jgi:hypothetical protein
VKTLIEQESIKVRGCALAGASNALVYAELVLGVWGVIVGIASGWLALLGICWAFCECSLVRDCAGSLLSSLNHHHHRHKF